MGERGKRRKRKKREVGRGVRWEEIDGKRGVTEKGVLRGLEFMNIDYPTFLC